MPSDTALANSTSLYVGVDADVFIGFVSARAILVERRIETIRIKDKILK